MTLAFDLPRSASTLKAALSRAAAAQIVAEIYKFRAHVGEYDPIASAVADTSISLAETAGLPRQRFVQASLAQLHATGCRSSRRTVARASCTRAELRRNCQVC